MAFYLLFFIYSSFGTVCEDLYHAACTNSVLLDDGTTTFWKDVDIQGLWQDLRVSTKRTLKKMSYFSTFDAEFVSRVSLKLEDCQQGTLNAHYGQGKISFCQLPNDYRVSLFQLTMILSHEISHAFEPCSQSLRYDTLQPILQCLRRSDSVGAVDWQQPDDKWQLSCEKKKKACELGNAMACTVWDIQGCRDLKPRCVKDQINETFADWLGIEILNDFLSSRDFSSQQWQRGLQNIAKLSCGTYQKESIYPQPVSRYNRLLLVHPSLREKMNCPESIGSQIALYCHPL